MLVVSRKRDEGLVLIHRQTKERIEILVTNVSGNDRCRLGIEASQEWKILRTPEHLDEAGNPIPNPLDEKKE